MGLLTGETMERKESAEVFKDVVIYRPRTDVPADVVEAMDVAMQIFASEPRMEREKEAELAAARAALTRLRSLCEDYRDEGVVDVGTILDAVLAAGATPTDRRSGEHAEPEEISLGFGGITYRCARCSAQWFKPVASGEPC